MGLVLFGEDGWMLLVVGRGDAGWGRLGRIGVGGNT